MRLELKRINLMSVQNSIVINISNRGFRWAGPPAWELSKYKLVSTRVYRGTSFFRSLYAFTDPNDHYN